MHNHGISASPLLAAAVLFFSLTDADVHHAANGGDNCPQVKSVTALNYLSDIDLTLIQQ